MIGGAVRVLAAISFTSAGASMAKASKLVEDAERAKRAAPRKPDASRDEAARRIAASLGFGDAPGKTYAGLTPEAWGALAAMGFSIAMGCLLNRAATVLGRR